MTSSKTTQTGPSLVEKDSYLLELCRYIVLNPVRAGLAAKPEHYPWSSYLPTLGKKEPPPCLTTDWLLSNFSNGPSAARQKYRRFVADGIAQRLGVHYTTVSKVVACGC